jgi:hypothetical protein
MSSSYITFRLLGQSADLGSQVQQYASLCAIAKQTGKEIVFPESCLHLGWGMKFDKLLEVPIRIEPDTFFRDFKQVHPQDGLLPDSRVFQLDEDKNYDITNLMHTHHYWNPSLKEEIYGLKWNQEYFQEAFQKYQALAEPGKELISLHIRRGDYLLHDHFCKLDARYYGEAIQKFTSDIENYHFVVFSNDIQWCKDNLIEGERVTFVEQGTDYVDMMLMSLCHHNIIANSSFSWWAAFRNRSLNKRIICPTNYVKTYSPYRFLNGAYYLPEWENINNDPL